jgi:hypothetical protein
LPAVLGFAAFAAAFGFAVAFALGPVLGFAAAFGLRPAFCFAASRLAGGVALRPSLPFLEPAASCPRDAALLAVARCGRVRGRLPSTPAPSSGACARPLLSAGPLTGHIIA